MVELVPGWVILWTGRAEVDMRVFGILTLLMVACIGPVADKSGNEICDNLEDDDDNGLVDCQDEACAGECNEVCFDSVDNDGDGAIDCADTDCDGLCAEDCGDGRDNDGDSLVDCADLDCLGSCPEDCADSIDNDGDGWVDCFDSDCDGSCPENCFDERDNDGDGLVDCADTDCDGSCAEDCDDGRDNDGDGHIDCADSDCDGRCAEVCTDGRDNDGDALVDCNDDDCFDVCDSDQDGFYNAAFGGDDCDDLDDEVFPGAVEVCDGKDNDCDTLVDDADPDIDPLSLRSWHQDSDGDGYGTRDILGWACLPPVPEASPFDTDCDDADPDVNPDATEVCGGGDEDCDRKVDDDDDSTDPATMDTFYADRDTDSYGDAATPALACDLPDGHVANDLDCDDFDPTFTLPEPWVIDGDGDGYGAGGPLGPDCSPPAAGAVREVLGEDCNDEDEFIYPGAPDICDDGVDSNCDGSDNLTWWLDADEDGYGRMSVSVVDCSGAPLGYVDNPDDCDDSRAEAFPFAEELCNRLDDSCDGVLPPDELDEDGDGVTPCEGDPDDEDPLVFEPPCSVLDDFEDGVWPNGRWTSVAGGGVLSGTAHDGDWALLDPGWYYQSEGFGAVGDVMSAWVRVGGSGRTYLGFDADAGGCKSLVLAPNTTEFKFQRNVGFGYEELTASPYSYIYGTWYYVELQFLSDREVEGRLFDSDGITLLSTVTHDYGSPFGGGGAAIRSFGNHTTDTFQVCF
jgi:hypothetical protein